MRDLVRLVIRIGWVRADGRWKRRIERRDWRRKGRGVWHLL